jgi:phospholipid-binding lipoprotein MlaA
MALPTALVAAGLAAATPQGAPPVTTPVPGPGQVVQSAPALPADSAKPATVTVLPAPTAPTPEAAAPETLDPLMDPAAESTAPEATAAAAAPDATARDPFEDELALQIKPSNDPLEGFNRISFTVSMAIDKVVLRPIALTYHAITPKPLRDGFRNGLSNLGEPMVFINDILQLKPKRAARTLGRFLLNTLLGIGGLFDVAKDKKFKLPHHSNRLSDTLGFYGIKPGPYIYLPLLGPATLRDEVDRVPGLVPWYDDRLYRHNRGTIVAIVSGLDERAENDASLKALLEDSVDPYATFRETWLQQRQGEIDQLKAPDGQEPDGAASTSNPLDTPLDDPAAPAPATPARREAATPTP